MSAQRVLPSSAQRVLLVHNRYLREGGEDAVVDAEAALLRARGHAVALYRRSNEELERMPAASAFAQSVWSRRTGADFSALCRDFRPDIVHVHNTFALVSGSLYWAAQSAGVPVVQTLHNYRLLCVQAMFQREERVCEDCLGRVPWRGVTRRCYHKSAARSAALAAALVFHRALGTYRHKVDRYIALTEFCRRKFIAGGLPDARIAVKPNFVEPGPPVRGPRAGMLFVGRLSAEKGVGVLLEALERCPGSRLTVVGAGPEQARVAAHPQVDCLGWLPPGQVAERMRAAACLVMPSTWFEGLPRTLIEAYACSLPVIASRIGSLAELVEEGRTGLLFEAGSAADLARCLARAAADPQAMRRMGEQARALCEARYSPRANYESLLAIYRDAASGGRAGLAAA